MPRRLSLRKVYKQNQKKAHALASFCMRGLDNTMDFQPIWRDLLLRLTLHKRFLCFGFDAVNGFSSTSIFTRRHACLVGAQQINRTVFGSRRSPFDRRNSSLKTRVTFIQYRAVLFLNITRLVLKSKKMQIVSGSKLKKRYKTCLLCDISLLISDLSSPKVARSSIFPSLF